MSVLPSQAEESRLRQIVRNLPNPPADFDPRLGQIIGFSGPTLRYLVHYVCQSVKRPRYLEVGVFYGATLALAMWKKQGVFIGIDNLGNSGFGYLALKESFGERIKLGKEEQCSSILSILEMYGNGQGMFIEKDHLEVPAELIREKTGGVNVFFYDGDHSAMSTAEGISHFAPALADEVVLVVDDYNSGEVRAGVQWGLRRVSYKVEEELICTGNTDIFLALLRKEELE